MSKHKPTIETTIKSVFAVSLSRIFVRKFFCKLLSKDLWQNLYLVKFHPSSIFFWTPLDKCVWSMINIILWDVWKFWTFKQLTLQNPHCKIFWWDYNKNESCKPYLSNEEQKWLFLVVSLSNVHIELDFARPFFACANKIARPKSRARRVKFVQLCVK